MRFSFDDAAHSLLALLLVRIVEVERKLRDIGVGFQFDLVPLYWSVLLYINNNKEIFQDKLRSVLVIGVKSSSATPWKETLEFALFWFFFDKIAGKRGFQGAIQSFKGEGNQKNLIEELKKQKSLEPPFESSKYFTY